MCPKLLENVVLCMLKYFVDIYLVLTCVFAELLSGYILHLKQELKDKLEALEESGRGESPSQTLQYLQDPPQDQLELQASQIRKLEEEVSDYQEQVRVR